MEIKVKNIEVNQTKPHDPRYKRRLRFSIVIIVSQMLLIALSVAWGIYLTLISLNGGSIVSSETNRFILYGEIIATGLIVVFAVTVVFIELKRMLARRSSDRS